MHRKPDDRDIRGAQLITAHAFGPEAAHVRLEVRTIKRPRDLRHLPFGAAQSQLAHHQEYGRGAACRRHHFTCASARRTAVEMRVSVHRSNPPNRNEGTAQNAATIKATKVRTADVNGFT